jgi:hypothetical protein
LKKKLGIVLLFALGTIAGLCGLYRYEFPYGMSHRCDKILYSNLRDYASKHGGCFPAGEATPEASISRISTLPGNSRCGYLLRRRDVPVEIVDEKLRRGELLGPETCGWNYVEGLRRDSNRELALFWDKEGLTENGMRLPEGGHWVTFVDGDLRTIPESEWADFMANQKKLLAEEMAKSQPEQWPEPQSQKTP